MKNYQELKKKILNNLTEWSVDPVGTFYNSRELSKQTYDSLEDYWFSDKKKRTPDLVICFDNFSDDKHSSEIKRAMINEIKQNSQDWHIEKEGSSLIIYKHKSGRKHYEVGFGAFGKDLTPDGEISQIRRAIEKKETPQSPTTSNQQVQK